MMKQLKDLFWGVMTLTVYAAMMPCMAQDASHEHEHHVHEHHEADQPMSGSVSEYVIMKSWDHQREIYLAKGMSESAADAVIKGNLTWYSSMDRTAGDDLIGVELPPFRFDAWLNSDSLILDELKGQVVLVRWFTDTCPFCASSAPALRQLYEDYTDKGLKMIGVFHPKAGRDDPLDLSRVERVVEARDFKFPIAVDWDWRNGTLKDWWLTEPNRPGTSVTFVIDKSGVVQFVHPGMEYHEDNGSELHRMCTSDFGRIQHIIEKLIAE